MIFAIRTESGSGKTFPTYKRASDYDKEAVAQVSRGDFILPSKDTVKDTADRVARAEEGVLALSVLEPFSNSCMYIDKYIVPLLEELPIQQVGIEAVGNANRRRSGENDVG